MSDTNIQESPQEKTVISDMVVAAIKNSNGWYSVTCKVNGYMRRWDFENEKTANDIALFLSFKMKTMDIFFKLVDRLRYKAKEFLVGKPGELIISLTPEEQAKLLFDKKLLK